MGNQVTPFPTIADLTVGIVPLGDPALPPAPDLPLETDLQGWNADHEIFDDLVRDVCPATIIEVGTWKGRSAMRFAKASQSIGSDIYCVDTWLGGIDHILSQLPQDDRKLDRYGSPGLYRQFLRNFVGTEEAKRIHPLQMTSTNAAKALAHHGIQADLIYIDGSHEYDDVYADLCAYRPLLGAGGVMFGDDFKMGGVATAVIRYTHEYNLGVKVMDHNYWIIN